MSTPTPNPPASASPAADQPGSEPVRQTDGQVTVPKSPTGSAADGSSASTNGSSDPADRCGESIAGYLLVRVIGRGGMGVVYEVRHEGVGSRAAMKLLPPPLQSVTGYAERFEREAKAASRISDPGLVGVFGHGVHSDGSPYILMEYVDGLGLREVLQHAADRRLQVATVLTYGRQIAEAMAAVHAAGIVHCDLKPENIKLAPEPAVPGGHRAKVLDFGIARGSDKSSVVTFGVLGNAGTPAYMSPERCAGARVIDGASDVYALGCILYELLCGSPPFVGPPEDLLVLHRYSDPVPAGALVPAVPSALDALILQMLAKLPTARPDMAGVAAALKKLQDAALASPPRRRFWIAGPQKHALGTLGGVLLLIGAAALGLPALQRLRHPGMVLVRGGTWRQLPPVERRAIESPREVRVPDFFLDAHEVTCGQFIDWVNEAVRRGEMRIEEQNDSQGQRTHFAVLGDRRIANLFNFEVLRDLVCVESIKAGQAQLREGSRDRSISAVSWYGAQAFCQAHGRRLPTEAEWQFAASGRGGFSYPWGPQEPLCERVVFGWGKEHYFECRQQANEPIHLARDISTEGIFDLAGLRKEWVFDCYSEAYPACNGVCDNPRQDQESCAERVLRGGSWASPRSHLDSAHRGHEPPDSKGAYAGFRCAADAW